MHSDALSVIKSFVVIQGRSDRCGESLEHGSSSMEFFNMDYVGVQGEARLRHCSDSL